MNNSSRGTLGINRRHASHANSTWYSSRSISPNPRLRVGVVYKEYGTVRYANVSRKGYGQFRVPAGCLHAQFSFQHVLRVGHSIPINCTSSRPFNTLPPVSASIQVNESVPLANNLSSPILEQKPRAVSQIRQHLRLWESKNTAPVISTADGKEAPQLSELCGHPTGQWGELNFEDGIDIEDYEESVYSTFDKGELVDFGDQRTELMAGDLVERRDSEGLEIEVAIYIRTIGSRAQFYTMSGKLAHGKAKATKFFIPRFVDPDEVLPLIPYLPNENVVRTMDGKLRTLEEMVPRDVGSPLVEKLLLFWRESDIAYRATASELDNAHSLVAQQTTVRYATLLELARELLPSSMRKNGNFPVPALYALHRCLMQDDVGFQAQRLGTHRTWGRFEICSIDEVKMIDAVSEDVRRYQESLAGAVNGTSTPSSPDFLSFIKTARNLIRQSRRTRDYTSHGMIGPIGYINNPSKGQAEIDVDLPSGHLQGYSDEKHRPYIRFMESWAGCARFGPHSRLNGMASAILRATGMYKDDILKRSVGWTFLQEIGAIAPWENQMQHLLRLGQVGQVLGLLKSEVAHWPQKADIMEGLRRDWGSLPVYCIDGADAVEIDDGISVEPADALEEYWVHIHTADPASGIVPRGDIAQAAGALVRSMYLPDQVTSMLPSSLVQQHFSLAPDRPSLTFSARLNINGDLLEQKITPGIVRNVLYLTPATFSATIGQQQPTDHMIRMTVGKLQMKSSRLHGRTRRMFEKHDFSQSDIRNLKLLHQLGNARLRLSFEKGALSNRFPSLEVSVSSNSKEMWRKHAESTCLRYQEDPIIQLSADAWDLKTFATSASTVMSMMLLTGEVAARWCRERGIPVINRVTQLRPGHIDPREYFHRVIRPSIEAKNINIPQDQKVNGMVQSISQGTDTACHCQASGGRRTLLQLQEAMQSVPLPVLSQYKRLVGSVLPSTTPGPHVALGLDMFTRVTSPLRRYSDLLVHWQIEAALLEEARLGASLIGSERNDYLPFKKHELDEFIPRLENRERLLNAAERGSKLNWTLQLLLRAWKFNEAPIPTAFEVVARDVTARSIKASIKLLGGMDSEMIPPKWLGLEDINIGDVFEAKIVDIDVYSRIIQLEPLRRIHIADEGLAS